MTFKIKQHKIEKLKQILKSCDAKFRNINNAIFQAVVDGCTITLYRNYKLLLQGKQVEMYKKMLLDEDIIKLPEFKYNHWLGVDESGKGDYFGPLVVCGAVVDIETAKKLFYMGVKDSKALSDKQVISLSHKIKNMIKFDLILIKPEKYNELYEKIQNLNKLLAWAHIRIFKNIISKYKIDAAIFDKFDKNSPIKSSLSDKNITIIEKEKGESDIGVATASIIARETYLNSLNRLSKIYNIKLPKGSGKIAKDTNQYIEKNNPELLKKIAKIHFNI